MIRNLIFDMGGVILPMRTKDEPIRRFARLGLDPALAAELFSPYGQKGIFDDVESGRLSAPAFLLEYEKLTGYAARFEDITWAWRGFICDPPAERLRWLQDLAAEGYHVALLSNTNPFLVAHTESAEFEPEGRPMSSFFHRVHYSFRLGACKPAPQAFRTMLEQGGYRADECLFLDDAQHNVDAALSLGIHAMHVPDNEDWIAPLRRRLGGQHLY